MHSHSSSSVLLDTEFEKKYSFQSYFPENSDFFLNFRAFFKAFGTFLRGKIYEDFFIERSRKSKEIQNKGKYTHILKKPVEKFKNAPKCFKKFPEKSLNLLKK